MPLDAVCLRALTRELGEKLTGVRVDKIFQPSKDEVVLSLRGISGVHRLLISANTNSARIHLTARQQENPASPPMFCMLLRKHLLGARLKEISQPPLERMVELLFDACDEMGEISEKKLIAELMGKRANLVLCGADGRVIDCVRRMDADMSARRQLLPGLFYRMPPAADKPGFMDAELDFDGAPEEREAAKWLLDSVFGLSPLICRELCFRASGAADVLLSQLDAAGRVRLIDEFNALKNRVKLNDFTPYILLDGDKPFDFSYMPIHQYEGRMRLEREVDFHALLERFYGQRAEHERRTRLSQETLKLVSSLRDRTVRRLASQRQELAQAERRDRLRQIGDMLSANVYALQKGMARARVIDFFDPEQKEVEIELDARLTPQQNAALYYKRYAKQKNAFEKLADQIKQGEDELSYLESVLYELSVCASERDIEEIKKELRDGGYLSRAPQSGRRKETALRPIELLSSSGMRIYIGRNNRQNDLLTMKFAAKRDLWLHVHQMPGAHVIVDCSEGPADEKTILEAAQAAAYYSRARESRKVPVDYTPVKFVKKPPGAKPGMVTYEAYKTILVDPSDKIGE